VGDVQPLQDAHLMLQEVVRMDEQAREVVPWDEQAREGVPWDVVSSLPLPHLPLPHPPCKACF